MERTINNYYPAKVWLATNGLGTAILFLCAALNTNIAEIIETIPLAFLVFFFSLLFSLPALGLFWLVFLSVRHLDINASAKKTVIAAAGILLVVITFLIISGGGIFSSEEWKTLFFPGSYAAALVLSTRLVRLYKAAPVGTDVTTEPAETT